MDNPNQDITDLADDLSYPPSGGRVKLILQGILLPLLLFYSAYHSWLLDEATWPGQGSGYTFHGSSATALVVTKASIGLFCHVRWFWGLLSFSWVFEIGTTISILIFLGSLVACLYYQFV